MLPIQRLVGVLGLLGATSVMTGCYAAVEPVPVYTTSAVVASDGYEPAYYDGYVVYYDDIGHPYYYNGAGAVVWVPVSSPHYVGLVNHWHAYGPAYHRWYASTGYRYHSYHAPAAYHGTYHASAHATVHRGGGHHR